MNSTKIYKIYGLIGYPLSHSFSPAFFKNKFEEEKISNSDYLTFPIKNITDFPDFIRNNNSLAGLNVTIPYKETIIPYLDELSDVAKEIKAVNTIVFKNGKLIGHNTDVFGFQKSLENFYQITAQSKALILGSGGASKAVQYVLRSLDVPFQVVSRQKKKGYINYKQTTISQLQKHPLIINTTPLGMYPQIDAAPKLKYKYLDQSHYLYDLVYNPERTLFLKNGMFQKTKVKSGGDMLIFQAEKAWELWNE